MPCYDINWEFVFHRKYLNDAQVAFGLQLAKIGKIQLLLNHLEDAKHSLFEVVYYKFSVAFIIVKLSNPHE